MSAILGIDYGEKRIGLAVADSGERLAVQRGIVENTDRLLEQLKSILLEKSVEKIVVGLPLGLDGSETPQTVATKQFVNVLQAQLHVPVETMDERMTSIEGGSDAGAAVLILQSYLDSHP